MTPFACTDGAGEVPPCDRFADAAAAHPQGFFGCLDRCPTSVQQLLPGIGRVEQVPQGVLTQSWKRQSVSLG